MHLGGREDPLGFVPFPDGSPLFPRPRQWIFPFASKQRTPLSETSCMEECEAQSRSGRIKFLSSFSACLSLGQVYVVVGRGRRSATKVGRIALRTSLPFITAEARRGSSDGGVEW